MTTARSPDISQWVGQKDEIKLSAANTTEFDIRYSAKAVFIEETDVEAAIEFREAESVDVCFRSAIL